MSSYRIYAATALGIVTLTAVAVFMIGSERYYPLVRVHLPDKNMLVFIDAPWPEQQRCPNVTQKISGMVGKNCSQCRIEERCTKELESTFADALAGQTIDRYVVQSGTLRIVIDAADASRQTCMVMAEQIASDKKQTALCVPPK